MSAVSLLLLYLHRIIYIYALTLAPELYRYICALNLPEANKKYDRLATYSGVNAPSISWVLSTFQPSSTTV